MNSSDDRKPDNPLLPFRNSDGLAGDFDKIQGVTGQITAFRTLPDAEIVCADCSEKMVSAAKRRAEEMGLRNVSFRQCDVGNPPFGDREFDAVVSLNGFHAFPDKEAACREHLPGSETGRRFLRLFLRDRRKRPYGQMGKARQNNGRAVMEAYGFSVQDMDESKRVAELMKLRQKLTRRQLS